MAPERRGRPGNGPSGPRDVARSVLERVEKSGAYSNRALRGALDRARHLAPQDRALATELVYGVLRRQSRLDRALEAASDRGLGGIDLRVRIALRMAAYQMLFLDRIPAYAAVDDAVERCKRVRGAGAAGLANALLRRLADIGEPPLPDAAHDPLGALVDACGLPEWLARLAVDELGGAEASAFGEAISRPAPLVLRANTLRTDRSALLASLMEERPSATFAASPLAPSAVAARGLDGLALTRAWKAGWAAVADAGAQLVVELCGAAPGERILDACAGLGGKSAHLAALARDRAEIHAVDVAGAKLAGARETFRRLGVRGVRTETRDLTQPLPPDAPLYGRILLDAPCSGLGVLRRHPETAHRRRPDDLPVLAAKQRALLESVAGRLASGGTLVYAVCTFERAECEEVIEPFLAAHPELAVAPPAELDAAAVDGLVDRRGFVRTWPQRHDADAFFAVRLRKSG